MKRATRRYYCVWWAIGGVAITMCLICPLGVIFHAELLHYSNRKSFNSEAWKAADASTRYDLSWDLIHGDVLNGKSQAEVRDLLGEPSHEYQGAIWYYDLGVEKYEFQVGPSGAVLIVGFEGGKAIWVRRRAH